MKKTIKKTLSLILTAAMCLSLSSCSVFKTMRENAEKASQIEIIETPDEERALELFNELISSSAEKADDIKENTSYKSGNPQVMSGDEKAGLLDAAAKQIRNLIMEGKPGKTSESITPENMKLLKAIDKASVLGFDLDRNYQSEKVTDENGNHILDDSGKNVTQTHIGDNILKLSINYFDIQTVATATDADGVAQEISETLPADTATIETVFGEAADKDAVKEEFAGMSDYFTLNDYEIAYTNCRVYSEFNLYENLIGFVRFEKNMEITATVTCLGKLAEYGAVTVTFPLTKTVEYTFAYPAEE